MLAEEEAANLEREEAERTKEADEAAAASKKQKGGAAVEEVQGDEPEEEIEIKVIDSTARERTMLAPKRPLKLLSSVLRKQIQNLPPAKFVDAPQTLVFDAKGLLYDRVHNWNIIQMPVIEKMAKMMQSPQCVEKKYTLLEKIQSLDEVSLPPKLGIAAFRLLHALVEACDAENNQRVSITRNDK